MDTSTVDIQNVQYVDVLLINMPFGILTQPSIGLSLLQSQLKSSAISSKILYFTLQFARITDISLYNRIASGEPAIVDQLGEWLFSHALFQDSEHFMDSYIDNILLGNNYIHRSTNPMKEKIVSPEFIDSILEIRAKIPIFLGACVQQVLQYQPKVVGFTSLFQQHLASLALARHLKSVNPDIKILFGGANCEGIMGAELIRQFRFVDAVVSGEGDLIISELIQRLLYNKTVDDIYGVYTRDNVDIVCLNNIYPNAKSVMKMDILQYPDYSDYFQQKKELSLEFRANILFETSRGCWWGEKHHCTFCGLNDLTLFFRSKSSERALSELIYLRDAYPDCPVILVDNILDMKYFQSYLPQLAALKMDVKLFYEVKANLKKDHVRLLKSAGIEVIQPGIESFSTHILESMNKGVKSLQNIQLLKWCKELEVDPSWNFLWGFPDEEPEEYERMAKIIPLVTHLPPPRFAQQIHLDRFSPLFDCAEQYGITHVRPYPSISYIYPTIPNESIFNLVYYFTYDYEEERNVREYVMNCAQQIEEWKDTYKKSALYAMLVNYELLIWDFRPISRNVLTRLIGLEQEIYLLCDTIQSLDTLRALIAQYLGSISREEVQVMLQRFIDRGLMLVEGSSYLSLAVMLSDATPKRVVFTAMLQTLEAAGRMPNRFRMDSPIGASSQPT